MSTASSMRRKLTGGLMRVRMRRQEAAERRVMADKLAAKLAAEQPDPPDEPKRDDVFERALPENQEYPPIVRQPASPEVIARVQAKADERRARRNARRLNEFRP